MGKNYQNKKIDASELAVPETVSVALGEIAADLREGLLALAVGTGLQVMASMTEADVTALAGPKGRHDPDRTAVRHGHCAGSVTLGGRRMPVARPRVRSVDDCTELPVPAYELFSGTKILGRMALDRMLADLSTRRYPVGLEPVGQRTEAVASTTSKSAVSRRFVAATETALAELLAADLSQLDLVALMVDGVHFGEHNQGSHTAFLPDYPYAQPTLLGQAATDSLTGPARPRLPDEQISYIRNSVKATVDAYDGTVTLYAMDETDPALRTWMTVFAGTVAPATAISTDLRAHLRYPEDLFKVQREMLTRYHVTNPAVFYTNDDFWTVPPDPTQNPQASTDIVHRSETCRAVGRYARCLARVMLSYLLWLMPLRGEG